MRCPNDNNELRIADRQGIEIDYCPECRGVWLDRGELDKIIERSAAQEAALLQAQAPQVPPQAPPQYGQPGFQGQGQPPYAGQPPYPQPPPQYYGEQTQPFGRRDYDDDDDDYRGGYDGHGRKKRRRENFLTELFDFD